MAVLYNPVARPPASWHAALGLPASRLKWYAGQTAANLTVVGAFAGLSVPAAADELYFPAQKCHSDTTCPFGMEKKDL